MLSCLQTANLREHVNGVSVLTFTEFVLIPSSGLFSKNKEIVGNMKIIFTDVKGKKGLHMLCISTSFWLLRAPESRSKYFLAILFFFASNK